MKKLLYTLAIFLTFLQTTSASLLDASKKLSWNTPQNTQAASSESSSYLDIFYDIIFYALALLVAFIVCVLAIKLMRLIFEIVWSQKLVYMKVTLPKADSKLDKEKETKKDLQRKNLNDEYVL